MQSALFSATSPRPLRDCLFLGSWVTSFCGQQLHGGFLSPPAAAGEKRAGVRSSEGKAGLGCRVLGEDPLAGWESSPALLALRPSAPRGRVGLCAQPQVTTPRDFGGVPKYTHLPAPRSSSHTSLYVPRGPFSSCPRDLQLFPLIVRPLGAFKFIASRDFRKAFPDGTILKANHTRHCLGSIHSP